MGQMDDMVIRAFQVCYLKSITEVAINDAKTYLLTFPAFSVYLFGK